MIRATHPRKLRGFTLPEVLIALSILAVALTALVKASTGHSDNLAYLSEKTFAHWVALNRMTEVQIATPWPNTGKREGSQEMAGQEWFWRQQTLETPDVGVKRIEIEVRSRKNADSPITQLYGFVDQSQ